MKTYTEHINEKNKDKLFLKLCKIISSCELNENRYNICIRYANEFKWEFSNDLTSPLHHLHGLFSLSISDLFDGEWSDLDTEPFYEHYKNIMRKEKELTDKEFVTSYAYAISGIVTSWRNFHKSPSEKSITIYNSNISCFNEVLRKVRKLYKIDVKTCNNFDVVINNKEFRDIIDGFKFELIV